MKAKKVTQKKYKQRNTGLNRCYKLNVPNKYLQNISPKYKRITFFSELDGTFSKIDHMLGHKASLKRYKKIEITPCILLDNQGIKLDTNNDRNNRKLTDSWELNNFLLNAK